LDKHRSTVRAGKAQEFIVPDIEAGSAKLKDEHLLVMGLLLWSAKQAATIIVTVAMLNG